MKIKPFSVAAATLLLLCSCSNSEPATDADPSGAAMELDFRLNPADKSRGYVAQYGSERELTSEEPAQFVRDVKVYVFKKNGSDYYYYRPGKAASPADCWDASSLFAQTKETAPLVGHEIEEHTYTVPASQRIQEEGDYIFVGIGRQSDDTDLQINLDATSVGVVKLQDMQAYIAANKRVRECFAGISVPYHIVPKESSKATLEMTRLVAGVILYVKNIPYKVSYNGTPTVVDHMELELASEGASINIDRMHGNRRSATPFTLMSIPLTGMTHADNIYTCPAITEGKVHTQANSVLSGTFVMPVNLTADTPTMKLILKAADGSALRTFNIYCAKEDIAPYAPSVSFGDDDAYPDTDPDHGGEYCPTGQTNLYYDLHPNHLYSIGIKKSPKSNDPDNDDIPINLSRDEEIVIRVNPNWAVLHNMGIGEESRINTEVNPYWSREKELGVK